MDKIHEVDIDSTGVFKYILIELKDKSDWTKTIVRGYEWAEYHADILDRVAPRLSEQGFSLTCLGGGRIRHENNSIHIYGYSVGYGQADHRLTVEILRRNFPHYSPDNITYSNSGY